MKQKLFTLFLALVASMGIIYASNTKVDGIWYNFKESNKTATVTYRGSSYNDYSNEYSGSVVIPSSVTYNGTTYSVTSIGSGAFQCCSSLTSVTIPNSVTGSIGGDAFYGCSSLTSINVDSNNPSYSSVDGVLFNKDKTTLVTYPGGKQGAYTIPNSVTSIGDYAFAGCSSLTSITIPNSVTSIGGRAFYECYSLTSITIPNSVTSIGRGAFNGCTSLISITISNSVTSIIANAFYDCSSLTSVTIPNSVTSIGEQAFYNCSSLTSVTIPNSVTSIGRYAFKNCSSLTSITIPNSVTSIGSSAFEGCSSLTSITIPNSVTSIGKKAFYGCSSLTSITIGNSVTSIGEFAFYGCSSLTSVTIPNSVTSIGERAFYGCSSLTSVTIGNSVTSIGDGAFEGCSNITSVTWNAKNCNNYNFGSNITTFTFGKEVEFIPDSLCSGMNKLTSITIPNNVTNIGERAFYGCTSVTSILIPQKVNKIGSMAFAACPSRTSIRVDSGNSTYDSRNNCNGIVEKSTNKLIVGCKTTVIPNDVKYIGDYAFYGGASSLTSITIPASVESIGEYAFGECPRLYDIYSYANRPPLAKQSSFSNYNAFVYVPCESQRYYVLDEIWSNFNNYECISSDNVTTDEIVVTPSENEANVIWPSVTGAASYELVIKDKDGNIVCTLIFNANGQLTSIAFNAPSRNGVPAQTQSAGFSFTITGLDSGTGYDLTLTAKDNSGNAIQTETISFITTGGNVSTDIDQLQGNEVQSTKVIKDGQVLILRNGKTYTMQGQEVK